MSEQPTQSYFLPAQESKPQENLVTQALFVLFFVNVVWALAMVGIVWMLH